MPIENPTRIVAFGDLASADAQIVLAEEAVPIARYTEQVLNNADAEYGGGFAQNVRDKNVRASANRVTLGEADATFDQ